MLSLSNFKEVRKESFLMQKDNRLVKVNGFYPSFEALQAYVTEKEGKLVSVQGISGFSIIY